MKNFTFREIHVGERSMGKIVAFLYSVVYYFGDLLKTGNKALVRKKTFIIL